MELVIGLEALSRADLAAAGGKGANLGELLRAGMPVPPGFVATTAAYDRVVAHNGLAAVIAAARERPEAAGGLIRPAFAEAAVPDDVRAAVLASYGSLGGGPVAVRSSATAEDLPGAAFAGQQETFLNVVGERQLMDALRGCWASLWSDRAIAYRRRLAMDAEDVKLAVVVQSMVPADVAGVLFTGDPVGGDRNLTVVDASAGLGEAVVGGLVTPDHYALRRLGWWPGGWRVVERRAGRCEVVVRPREGGGTERAEPPRPRGSVTLLSGAALRRLASLGAAIEAHFGAPQDVEWASAGGRLVILQARPITALAAPPPTRNRVARLIAGLIAELVTDRPYPLEATSWGPQLVLSSVLGPMFRLLGVAVRFDRLFLEEDGVLVRLRNRLPIRPTPALALAPIRLASVAARFAPARWRQDPLLERGLHTARALEARDPAGLGLGELAVLVREAMTLPELIGVLRVRYAPRAVLAAAQLRLALTLLRHSDLFPVLLFSGVETKTLETNRALESLAARIRETPALRQAFTNTAPDELAGVLARTDDGGAFLQAFEAFLARYGHRETGSTLQASLPTWRDAPDTVLAILAGMARAEPTAETGAAAFARARAQIGRRALLRLPGAARAFDGLVIRARRFPELREDTRFYATLALPAIRRALLQMGHRLAVEGVLDDPSAVFHVKLEEIEAFAGQRGAAPIPGGASHPRAAGGELRRLVAARKAKRDALAGTPMVDPRFFQRPGPAGAALARGAPGSPGVAEGPVRVVMGASDFGSLAPGEVLVAPFTNPAWTPLFQHAAAVVVDTGGAASHAAIVAREYGIPAVMGTADGTRRLTTGQRVRVDGSSGVVLAVPTPEERD